MFFAIITTAIQRTAKRLAEKIKLSILNALLWGGVVLLALEHIWHGEVVPWPPFLTAMKNPADIPVMLHEMATTGTAMTIATVGVWLAILGISRRFTEITTPRMGAIKIEKHVAPETIPTTKT